MKCSTYATLILTALALGCGSQDRAETGGQPAERSEALDRSREKEAIDALKQLGANVARDGQGRAKVLRLSGPKITDAELEHVAALTELRVLYLEGTKVTDAGMARLEPLKKLERLHWVVNITSARERPIIDALRMPIPLDFSDVPLLVVLETMGDWYQIPFKIDKEGLEAAGCSPLAPVTAKHEDVSLREALAFILEPLDLVWTIQDGAVVVTTEEALAEKWPHLAKLRKAVPTLKDVTIDFQAAPERPSER